MMTKGSHTLCPDSRGKTQDCLNELELLLGAFLEEPTYADVKKEANVAIPLLSRQ